MPRRTLLSQLAAGCLFFLPYRAKSAPPESGARLRWEDGVPVLTITLVSPVAPEHPIARELVEGCLNEVLEIAHYFGVRAKQMRDIDTLRQQAAAHNRATIRNQA